MQAAPFRTLTLQVGDQNNANVSAKHLCGRDNIVGIATRYALEGPELRPSEGEVWSTHTDRPRSPQSLLYIRHWVYFPGVEEPWPFPAHPPLSKVEVECG